MKLRSFVAAMTLLASARALDAQTTLRELSTASTASYNTEEGQVKSYGPVPIEAVWTGVQNAYRQNGFRASSLNIRGYQIIYLADSAGPKLGNMKIESVFDCGGDKKSPLAKTLALGVSITTQVRQVGSTVETLTRVMAIPPEVPEGEVAPRCVSKGALEKKLTPEFKFAFTVTRVQR